MMAITETLPVGNEVATATVGKTATVDATAFAVSLVAAGKASGNAAGKASGNAAGGKGAGAAAPVKGQQDLAGWVQDHGSEVRDGLGDGGLAGVAPAGVAAGDGDGGLAVSSAIGKQEIVETPPGASGGTGSQDLNDAVVGTGIHQAVGVLGDAVRAGVTSSADLAGSSTKTATAAQGLSVAPLVAGTDGTNAPRSGTDETSRVVGVGKSLIVAESAGHPTAVALEGTGVESTLPVSGAVAPAARAAHASKAEVGGLGLEGNGGLPVRTEAAGSGAVPVATGAKLSNPGLPVVTGEQAVGAQAGTPVGARSGAKSEDAAGLGSKALAVGAGKTSGASSRKEKKVEVASARGADAAVASFQRASGAGTHGTPDARVAVASAADVSVPASAAVPVASALVSAPAVASALVSAPAVAGAGVQTAQGGTAAAQGETTGGAAGALSTSTLERSVGKSSARLGVDVSASPSAVVSAVPVRAGDVAKAVAGSRRSAGATEKIATGEAPAAPAASAAPVSVGDGSSVLPVAIGIAAAAVPVAAPAPGETGTARIVGVAARAGAKVQGGGAVSGAAPAIDKDGHGAVSTRRSDGTAGAHAGAGDSIAAGATGTASATGVQGVTAGKSAAEKTGAEKTGAEQGKAQDAGLAVSGPANLTGSLASNAHVSAAVGWNGGVTSAAVPVHTPGAVSGTTGSGVLAESVTGSGGAASLSSGASTGLVGSGQGHTTLQATPTVLEVGVPGGSHGWLKIRAELGEGGSVQASMSSATQAGQDALRKELPAMSAYLQSEHVPVSLQMAHGAATVAGGALAAGDGAAAGLGFGFGSGLGGQTGANPEQSRSDGSVGVSAGSPEAEEQGNGRQQGSDGDLGAAVTAVGVADGVSAAVASAATDWTYGGVSTGSGGNWVNVIA